MHVDILDQLLFVFLQQSIKNDHIVLFLFADFAMSNEIKENEDVHPETKPESDELREETVETQEPLTTITLTEEATAAENPVEHQEEEKEEKEEIQPTTSTDSVEIEPSVLTDDIRNEAPSIPIPSPDVIVEKEDEPLSAPASEENVDVTPTAEETTPTTISAQSEEPSQVTNTHQHPLLRSIAGKSNQEASSIILNTVRSALLLHRCSFSSLFSLALSACQWRFRCG